MFSSGLLRLLDLPDWSDVRVPESARSAHRYFSVGLPLHAIDEDVSLAPRLLGVAPECGALLADLEREHQEILRWLDRLLPLLARLGEGAGVDRGELSVASKGLLGVLIPHIDREERELFGFCERLSEEDRLAFGQELIARRA